MTSQEQDPKLSDPTAITDSWAVSIHPYDRTTNREKACLFLRGSISTIKIQCRLMVG